MIQAITFDFDGTIVNIDLLTFICGLVGKEKASEELHQAYLNNQSLGVGPLTKRINFLRGVTLKQLHDKLSTAPPMTLGIKELVTYARNNNILTIISSGNILPLLEYYKNLLGIDYVIGSPVRIENETIVGISESDFPHTDFKMEGVKKILNSHEIDAKNLAAIGDSVADLSLFNIAGMKIAINPINGFEKYADFVIKDFCEVIPLIERANVK